jgi:hypothetical protein
MPRWFIAFCLGGSALAAFACNDETVEEVDKDVCYSGMRWVGDKRGSPEMFPGRDCVGCHIDNDGPPLAVGGTIYPYVLSPNTPGLLTQSGPDCFGVEGVDITITDALGEEFQLTTNRAGNFFIEGKPEDFAKPFTAAVNWLNPRTGMTQRTPMGTQPSYGGCANCHNPYQTAHTLEDGESADKFVFPTARIGLPGNGPGADGFETIEAELNFAGCVLDDSNPQCDRILGAAD